MKILQKIKKKIDNRIEPNQTKFSANQVGSRCASFDFSITEHTFAYEHIIWKLKSCTESIYRIHCWISMDFEVGHFWNWILITHWHIAIFFIYDFTASSGLLLFFKLIIQG